MSEEIVTRDAFMLSVTRFVRLLTPEHLPGLQSDVIRLFQERMEANLNEGEASIEGRVSRYATAIKAARSITNVSDFLITLVKDGIKRKEERFKSDAYIYVFAHEDYECEDVVEITLIRCVSRMVIPLEPESVVLFYGRRDFQWWDGPVREPLLCFDPDQFFERRLTNAGEAMARTLGQTNIGLDTWIERH